MLITLFLSASQVMYFSSVFPYVVLFIFLIRGVMLDGAMDGITYMFYPKVSTAFYESRCNLTCAEF